jgi:hypothetical protein
MNHNHTSTCTALVSVTARFTEMLGIAKEFSKAYRGSAVEEGTIDPCRKFEFPS